MTSTIKVDNIQDQDGNNIINENSNTITVGASGDTIIIPSGATITNNGTQTGFGRTGTVDWDTTPKTATFTAVSGDGFFCNTTSSAFTCNLPAGSAGAIVSVADYAGTWSTNNLTVSPNGSDKIGGTNADVVLDTEGQSVTFVFVDSTQGWINVQDSTSNERASNLIVATGGTVTTSGNDKIHTFTGPGTFTVCRVAVCAANNVVSYVVVAGGAAGGFGGSFGGGGGAGGFREYKSPVTPYTASPLDGNPGGTAITVTAQAYPITVGGGGAGLGPGSSEAQGAPGNNSIFSTVTSTGGGGGGEYASSPGLNGGSGGGSANAGSGGGKGNGNTPPVSPPQGQPGGDQNPGYGSQVSGGGGATVAGSDAAPGNTSNGGAGATTSITGSSVTYAGGGGGGANAPITNAGGSGGGGAGGHDAPNQSGTAGTDNTGGGGGGNGPTATSSGSGGSGIVIIRYKFQ